MKLETIVANLNRLYPQTDAQSWDNVGLQIGDPNQEIKTIMTSLEITTSIVQEAIDNQVDLIVVHHPLIFKPCSNLVTNPDNSNIITLIEHHIALYVMHTNLDVGINGMNDWLAQAMELDNVYELNQEITKPLIELNVLGTSDDIQRVKYLLATYALNPHAINQLDLDLFANQFNTIKVINDNHMQLKLETCILASDQEIVANILTDNNINNFTFSPVIKPEFSLGLGRIGMIKPVKALTFAKRLKKVFKDQVSIVGDENRKISKIAVVGGSGCSYMQQAISQGCDCLVTGDVKYHDAQAAIANNFILIDIGHYAEVIFKYKMKDILLQQTDAKVLVAKTNINPFKYV